jgi:hypothetical protein
VVEPRSCPWLLYIKVQILNMWVSQGCEALYCTVQYITLKVHKIENSFGSDFEFCTISLLVQILRFCKKNFDWATIGGDTIIRV